MRITKEILENAKKLYLEGNSTKKVSEIILKRYGIKVNQEVLRRKLKKLGIIRDNSACQKIVKRRHLPIEEIVRLYSQEQMSLRKLAKRFRSNKKTIHKVLEENGTKVRNNDDSIRLSNTKHPKSVFSGNECEKAYMIGLIKGDITPSVKSKFTLRLTTSSSRKALLDLFKNVFGNYGPIYIYASQNVLSNYNWKMTADLDLNSFGFLLKPKIDLTNDKLLSLNFIAGLVDSDGSIFIRKSGKYFQYVVRIYNENISLLKLVKEFLYNEGFNVSFQLFSKVGDTRKSKGVMIKYNNDYYVVELTQKKDVVELLSLLPLKHPEKILWKNKIQIIEERRLTYWNEISREVEELRNCIKRNYQNGLAEAEELFRNKITL
jgi:hypothetical protein